MGLNDEHIYRNVTMLSGRQRQPVAISKLDDATTTKIISILRQAVYQNDKYVIIVTHVKQLATHADTVLTVKNETLQQERDKWR